MAQTAVYVGANDGGKLYRVGQVGSDSGSAVGKDSGSQAFTATLKTERVSPAGENGLAHFRRVGLRMLRSGPAKITMRVYVDDEQTKIFDNTKSESPETVQEIVFDKNSIPLGEDIIEADINAVGTYIQVELEITSSDILGTFLAETLLTHYRPIRTAAQRDESAEAQ